MTSFQIDHNSTGIKHSEELEWTMNHQDKTLLPAKFLMLIHVQSEKPHASFIRSLTLSEGSFQRLIFLLMNVKR